MSQVDTLLISWHVETISQLVEILIQHIKIISQHAEISSLTCSDSKLINKKTTSVLALIYFLNIPYSQIFYAGLKEPCNHMTPVSPYHTGIQRWTKPYLSQRILLCGQLTTMVMSKEEMSPQAHLLPGL